MCLTLGRSLGRHLSCLGWGTACKSCAPLSWSGLRGFEGTLWVSRCAWDRLRWQVHFYEGLDGFLFRTLCWEDCGHRICQQNQAETYFCHNIPPVRGRMGRSTLECQPQEAAGRVVSYRIYHTSSSSVHGLQIWCIGGFVCQAFIHCPWLPAWLGTHYGCLSSCGQGCGITGDGPVGVRCGRGVVLPFLLSASIQRWAGCGFAKPVP